MSIKHIRRINKYVYLTDMSNSSGAGELRPQQICKFIRNSEISNPN